MKNIKFGLVSIKKNIKNAKELKSAFITTIIGMSINNVAFIFLWYFFGKTVGTINGFTPFDIFGLYAFSGIAFGLINSIFYGIFNIPIYISSGNFDKYLLTPKNILLKVSTSDIQTSAIGDLIFGLICFIIYIVISKLSLLKIIVSLFLIIIASIVYYSFALICMSISFYVMDGENLSNGLYGTFISVSLYHGGAFNKVLKFIFVFIIPSLLTSLIPVEIIKNLGLENIILFLLLAIMWLSLSIIFFYKSLRKYESNNLFGFGN